MVFTIVLEIYHIGSLLNSSDVYLLFDIYLSTTLPAQNILVVFRPNIICVSFYCTFR